MEIRAKRWDEPRSPADGWRVLVCRYRPRALRKKDETWDEWMPEAGPSRELHAAYFGKTGEPIGWDAYRLRYLEEMKRRERVVEHLSFLARRGPLTLLCAKGCVEPSRCHRTLLKALVEGKLAAVS